MWMRTNIYDIDADSLHCKHLYSRMSQKSLESQCQNFFDTDKILSYNFCDCVN